MTSFSRAWNAAYEVSPPGTQAANLLDTRIQEVKIDVRQRLEVEHYMDMDSDADETIDGVHMFPGHNLATRDAIATPQDGQLIRRTDIHSIDIYDGSAWVEYQSWMPGDMKTTAYDDAAALGWVKCDGASYLRTGIYEDLFNVIGVDFGNDDATHFNVPDMSGKFPIGIDSGGDTDFDAIAETGGEKEHTLLEAEMAAHVHDEGTLVNDQPGDHNHDARWNADPGNLDNDSYETGNNVSDGWSDGVIAGAGDHGHTITGDTGSIGSDTAHNNMPPFITMQWYIKL